MTDWQRMKLEPAVARTIGVNAEVYQKVVTDGHLSVFLTVDDGMVHLSISHRTNGSEAFGIAPQPGRYPTWDEIVDARYRFCPGDVTMAMLLPPKEQYVNIHETTFHLWELKPAQ